MYARDICFDRQDISFLHPHSKVKQFKQQERAAQAAAASEAAQAVAASEATQAVAV